MSIIDKIDAVIKDVESSENEFRVLNQNFANRLNKNFSSAKQTIDLIAVSGIKVSPFCEELLYKIEDGLISYEEAVKAVKDKYIPKQIIGIRIKSCSDSLFWYRNKVGTIVPYVYDTREGEWMSREDAGYLNIVKYKDGGLVYATASSN